MMMTLLPLIFIPPPYTSMTIHLITRYKQTIVTIATREQDKERTVAAQKEELQ